MFKINKITLLMLILFGVSLAGCVTMKKVADAIVPDILLPDSILYDDKEETESATGTTVAESTHEPVKSRETMTTKNYVEFIIACLFVIIGLGLLRYFIRKKNQK